VGICEIRKKKKKNMVLLVGFIFFVDFGYVLFDASFFELEFANWAFGFCRVFLGGFIVIL
jgi:hypothetical protein